jgi:hypothetical protein
MGDRQRRWLASYILLCMIVAVAIGVIAILDIVGIIAPAIF